MFSNFKLKPITEKLQLLLLYDKAILLRDYNAQYSQLKI